MRLFPGSSKIQVVVLTYKGDVLGNGKSIVHLCRGAIFSATDSLFTGETVAPEVSSAGENDCVRRFNSKLN
jgi:hypothetical protein